MNKQVVEIINYLIKEILTQGDLGLDASEVIKNLLDMGYRPEDIDRAFELIFYTEEIIDLPSDRQGDLQKKFRVLTPIEKQFIIPEVQGVLIKLHHRELLTGSELDRLIYKVISYPYFPVTMVDLGILLKAVAEDESRLYQIAEEIPELSQYILDFDDDYVH